MEKYLESKFPEEANRLILRMDTHRAEFIDIRDKHDNQLNYLNEKLAVNYDKLSALE